MQNHEKEELQDFSLKSLFLPFTTTKAIHYLLLIGILVYANSFFNNFIADDSGQLLDNPLVHSISNFFIFFQSGSFGSEGSGSAGIYYKPIFSLFLSIIYSMFGANAFFFHLIQLLLHVTNSVLVYLLLQKFLRKPLSFLLAAIFLVHPINNETVVYVSDMQEVLFFLFGMIGLLLSMKKELGYKRICLIQLFLLLSLLAKETGILFVLVTNITVFYSARKQWKTFLFSTFLSLVVYSFLRFILAGIYFNQSTINPIMAASFTERLFSIPTIFVYYITTFLFPKELLFNQQWVVTNPTFSNFGLPLIITVIFFLVLGLLVTFVIRKHSKQTFITLFFLAWFCMGIIIHLQLVPLDATIADRWFYFPIVGLLALLGLGLESLIKKPFNHNKRITFISISLILLLLLSVRSIIRNTNWQNPITLYTHDIPLMQPNFSLENALAYEYFKAGDKNDAFYHAKKSVGIFRNFVNLTNLGALYAQVGDYPTAKKFYAEATANNPRFYLASENMAVLLVKQGSKKEANNFLKKALVTFPKSPKLWLYMIVNAYQLGDKNGALEAAQQYYLLTRSAQSYAILQRLENNESLNINIK
ncbi:MAG: hypothetical protein ACREHC_08850 [Candidatus Levyibacteriota bacterium]